MAVRITRLQYVATIPARFAQAVFSHRANLIKIIQGQPAPQLDIVLQAVIKYSVQGLIQILSQVQPGFEVSRLDFKVTWKRC